MFLADHMVLSGHRALIHSYAKINLSLDVLGKRDNGYHDVEMIMQTLNLFDLLMIDRTERGVSVATNLKYLPTGEKNLAYRAAKAFFEATGLPGGVRINIQKNIPVAAGLAGGSGNSAAVLCAMNALFNAGLSEQQLCEISAPLGADIPYCLTGGTQLAQGIGEKLTSLAPLPKTTVLLVKPPINISTAAVYAQIDSAPIAKRPDTRELISALEQADLRAVSSGLCNVMESVTSRMHPVIRGIREKMLLNGALGSIMSGSGPTVFGLFLDEKKAKQSADSFALQFKDVFLTKTLN
jgi:4-diphosphocytidyl-2-C-methyl-D-erythritol kinase